MRRRHKASTVALLIALNLLIPLCMGAAIGLYRLVYPTSFNLTTIARWALPWHEEEFEDSTECH